MSNLELARRAAAIVDALAAYDHLPSIENVGVTTRGPALLYPRGKTTDQWRAIALWADAFNVPVNIDLTYGAELTAAVELAGIDTAVTSYIADRMAYALGAAVNVPAQPGGKVEVPPARLLGVLASGAVAL